LSDRQASFGAPIIPTMAKGDHNSTDIVWIAEDHDANDSLKLTGRFSGYFDRGKRMVEELEDVSAGEAIAWGRQRASVVLIRTGDSDYYSAGERNPDPEEFPPWPPPGLRLEPRRPRGFEALDSTEHSAPALWDVRVEAQLSGDAKPFHDAVKASAGVRDVRAPAPGYGPASAAFLVEVATHKQAVAIAETVLGAAVQAMLRTAPRSGHLFWSGHEVYPHRSGESVTGPGVTY
jgi:hypothetical protein